jgi:hypothetical protein
MRLIAVLVVFSLRSNYLGTDNRNSPVRYICEKQQALLQIVAALPP